jgi:hypothetical protein
VASKYKPGTLPDHDWCTIHKSHMLGCGQFEQLIARSGQRCEICTATGTSGRGAGKLHIDHDHTRPRWAVRGLLCHACNSALTVEVAETCAPWAAKYLGNSWWIKECERVGVSTEMGPEPDCGAVIRDQFEVVWLRSGDGKWRPRGHGRSGINSADWAWLHEHRGPHNMRPLDLYGSAERDRSPWEYLAWDAERAGLHALLSEVGKRNVPAYTTRARGTLLAAFMGEPTAGVAVLCL